MEPDLTAVDMESLPCKHYCTVGSDGRRVLLDAVTISEGMRRAGMGRWSLKQLQHFEPHASRDTSR